MIFDVGANCGDVALRYRQMFPEAHIHCFEPLPDTCALLRKRFENDSRASIHQVAVCESEGDMSFQMTCANDSSSLFQPDMSALPASYHRGMAPVQSLAVPAITLDGHCQTHGIDQIDLLKMDIQGGELGALKGARDLLERQAVQVIYAEAFFLPFYLDQPLFGELSSFLTERRYHLHGIYNPVFSGQSGRLQWADAIFVNDALASRSRQIMRECMKG